MICLTSVSAILLTWFNLVYNFALHHKSVPAVLIPVSLTVGFSDNEGDFRAPMFLLAVLTGRPRNAEGFFGELRKAPASGNLQALVDKLPKSSAKMTQVDKKEWERFLGYLRRYLKSGGFAPANRVLQDWLPDVSRIGYGDYRS